jgi:hypothetical protein
VEAVFQSALQKQSDWASSDGRRGVQHVSVVFMDEAGLPEDAKESLKVLHYYLENSSVAFVGISNRPLDPAKMNR